MSRGKQCIEDIMNKQGSARQLSDLFKEWKSAYFPFYYHRNAENGFSSSDWEGWDFYVRLLILVNVLDFPILILYPWLKILYWLFRQY